MQYYLIAGMFVTLAFAIFAVQNATPVDVRLFLWKFEQISLVLVILGSAILGAVVGLLSALGSQIRMAMQIRELNLRQRELVEELQSLRVNIDPVSDGIAVDSGIDPK
jgi:uncharacterized integral membrane protein